MIYKGLWVILVFSTQVIALTQTCYSGPPNMLGTPEELISSYFGQENQQHVHPMANSTVTFVPQVSHASPESGHFGQRDPLNLYFFFHEIL